MAPASCLPTLAGSLYHFSDRLQAGAREVDQPQHRGVASLAVIVPLAPEQTLLLIADKADSMSAQSSADDKFPLRSRSLDNTSVGRKHDNTRNTAVVAIIGYDLVDPRSCHHLRDE